MRRSADRSWVSYEPVGVVLAVMPWNFPLWQVFRFAAPALMAGNAALLKHSPNTTGAALACQDILTAAGLPDGLFTALLVAEPDVPGHHRAADRRPPGGGGHHHRQRARRQRGRRPSPGGRSRSRCWNWAGRTRSWCWPTPTCPGSPTWRCRGRFLNAGQSCISPKRFIVEAVGRRGVHRGW